MFRATTLQSWLMPLLVLILSFASWACSEEEVCPDGQIRDEHGECVDPPRVCSLWEPDCCLETVRPRPDRGSRDCFGLDEHPHTAACDQSTGTCILLCNTRADCVEFYPGRCGDGECVCDSGVCPLPSCSSHADCAGEGLCVGGECLPGEANPDQCIIAPEVVYTRQGEITQLHVHAIRSGKYVVPSVPFTWSSAQQDVVSVDASSGILTGGSEESSTTVTASAGSASCSVEVTNFASIAAGDARVLVLDEVTRMPLVGVKVVLEVGEIVEGVTDGAGVAAFTAVPSGTAIDLHVLPELQGDAPNGYSYVSAIGTNERDFLVYVPRNPSGQGGGIKGTMRRSDFTHIGPGTVHVALAGLSIPSNLIDMDLNLLLGEIIETRVQYSNVLDRDLLLPSGLVMGINDDFFKPWYAPLGVPGRRTGWMLGGNLRVDEVLRVAEPFLGEEIDGEIAIGPLVKELLPMFQGFYSAVTPGIMLTESELPDSNEAWPPSSFTDASFELSKPLSLKGIVDVPVLPKLDGKFMDGAIVIGGAMVQGQGLVPLGLSAGADTEDDSDTPDGRVNSLGAIDDPAVGPGQLAIRLAPQHGGIEGSRYALVALALSFDGFVAEEARNPLSGMVTTFDSLSFEENVDFGANDFLGLPEAARYTASSRTITPASVTGANLYRVSISGPDERGWVVYHQGTQAMSLFDPTTVSLEDRASGNINAQAVKTSGGIGVNEIFKFNSTNMDGLIDFATGFSTIAAIQD